MCPGLAVEARVVRLTASRARRFSAGDIGSSSFGALGKEEPLGVLRRAAD